MAKLSLCFEKDEEYRPLALRKKLRGYIDTIADRQGQNDFTHKAIKYLELFPGGNISLGGVTEKWLENFQEYLLKETRLSKKNIGWHTARHTFAVLSPGASCRV
ncbi:MAG: phage integrase SAM-like domain-containing protein [Treponema sp.]|jgi:hypothetical protein|nr:phage integrase SAM-like domain-containing protein [Treponema sp.]